MLISELFPGRYLKAADIPAGQQLRLTVSGVRQETMESSGEQKGVVHFLEEERGLVLNVTNANVIAESYGEDMDAWSGKPVLLFSTTTDFAGKRVPCIRVRAPEPTKSVDKANIELANAADVGDPPF